MRRSRTLRSFGFICAFACLLLTATGAHAQSTLATLTGTVADASAAVVPGARVAAVNLATGVERSVVTDAMGTFQIPNIDAARYLLTVSIQGFQDNVREVDVLARQIVRIEVALQIAGTTERVEVRGAQPVIETDRSTIGNSRSGEDIDRLALNFRATDNTSPIVVATLAQGVQQDRTGAISMAGAMPFMTSFSVDGISSQRIRGGGPSRELFPSVESIEEFKVTTAGNNAEFMQETDLTTITKSGTNQLHGSAFWFFQDSGMTAATRFTPKDAAGNPIKPEVRTNSFGGSTGGPVVRNRLFFFATYEGVRQPNETTLSQIVPPDAWRTGDLSSVASAIRNPATGQPFPGNRIPVNAASARILDLFYERQNQPTGGAIDKPNFIINAPGEFTVNGYDGRGDYVVSPSQKVFARLSSKNVDKRGATGNWNTKQGDSFKRTETRQIAASHNWTLGPSLLNEIRGGWSNTVEKTSYTNATQGVDLMAQAGLTGLPPSPAGGGFPAFRFGDGSFIATGGVKPFNILSRVVQGSQTLTWLSGSHAVKSGVDIQYVEYKDQISFFDGEEFGRYEFDGFYTGHAFADFLLGVPRSTGYILPAPDVNPYSTYYGLFVQDDWRPTPTLTINYGVRYDLRPPMLDRTNQLGNFDRDFPGGRVIVSDEAGLALVPEFVRKSVPNTPFLTATEAGLPKSLRRADKNNVNPRFGVAWRPLGDSRTVIRGGVGLYTVPLLGSVNYSMVATVTAAAVNFANNAAAPFVFPQISSAATAEGALPPGTLDFRRANQIDMKDPRTVQWNVTFERDLGWSMGARISYIGSKTNDLIWSPDLNQVPANSRGYAAVAQTRPFRDWNVVTTRDNGPKSRYDGLGLELNKRFSNSFAFNASYTLARHLSDAGGTVPTAFAAENGATTADLFRGDADYGDVAFTRRHRFVSTWVYEIPVGRSRARLSDIGPALDAVVGGWDVAGVLLIQSGPFLTPLFSNGDPSGTGTTVRGFTATQRPDAVGDGNISNPTAEAYFNASAFVRPADNIGRFGNAEVGSLIGPGTRTFSMTLGKNITLRNTSHVRLELAFSNLFNIENLDVPSQMAITSSAFGRITATQSVDQAGPRTIQMSLRYRF
ncbi:MAG TPA: carboxypeptidase-like regulatory domain-containing protein [Vicinamibacterales bacterium]|nr:carboxypeptidase-like regulatory domain-containing protein [Vicinamibacterales bacterium]